MAPKAVISIQTLTDGDQGHPPRAKKALHTGFGPSFQNHILGNCDITVLVFQCMPQILVDFMGGRCFDAGVIIGICRFLPPFSACSNLVTVPSTLLALSTLVPSRVFHFPYATAYLNQVYPRWAVFIFRPPVGAGHPPWGRPLNELPCPQIGLTTCSRERDRGIHKVEMWTA